MAINQSKQEVFRAIETVILTKSISASIQLNLSLPKSKHIRKYSITVTCICSVDDKNLRRETNEGNMSAYKADGPVLFLIVIFESTDEMGER